jgi:hypothetical protein
VREVEDFRNIQHPKKRAFLEAFSQCGTITHAAEAAGIDDSTYYTWATEGYAQYDPEFVKAMEKARKAATENLIKEARRRAVEGVQEPVFHKGEVVGYKRRYSDNLLMFLIKGEEPEKYADYSKVEKTGTTVIKFVHSVPRPEPEQNGSQGN